ncbi:YMGG-like glycine zipper-containing protein [Natronosalvus halobius]|uniref:YMGG-like glycine zipper-containing protein n=1 Tax=Natronosalvus halobius TaxID=2953746 RepID=UPI00209E5584|nr:YMGG-like glycine zipper-containing protein [Natronosalvus halobius]USZ71061.1 glycine zipper family protein [Natronosalvus halobius]
MVKDRLVRAMSRARYAAMGAAVGAFLGGLLGKQTASTGAALGALVGATFGEHRPTVQSRFDDLKSGSGPNVSGLRSRGSDAEE